MSLRSTLGEVTPSQYPSQVGIVLQSGGTLYGNHWDIVLQSLAHDIASTGTWCRNHWDVVSQSLGHDIAITDGRNPPGGLLSKVENKGAPLFYHGFI